MKVIVCGAGQVGANIARTLSEEDIDVTVLDRSETLVKKLSDSFDVKGVVGFASHPEALERAGAGEAEMLIAVTQSDEVNMTACEIAQSLFDVPKKIARIRTQAYLEPQYKDIFARDRIPIDVIISPEYEVARTIQHRMSVPGAFDVIPFAEDRVRVVGIHIDERCPVIDTPLRQLTELFPDLNAVVVGIQRGERLIVPTGSDQILIGDAVYIVADKSHVERALVIFGHEEKEARRVVIVGGGSVGLFLARMLEDSHSNIRLKVIERDPEKAEAVAREVKRSIVLIGDALDRAILREANVEEAETVVTVTNDDKVNILAALLAKKAGARKAVTLINNVDYGPLIASLGIDVSIDPGETTVSTILRHVRRGRIRGLHTIGNGQAEVLDMQALATSSIVGTPLRQLNLPAGVLIGAIVRDGKPVIPRGETVIRPEDHVVIFAKSDVVRKVERLFAVGLEFF
jgi:trk system potassium uptake protein TrkA